MKTIFYLIAIIALCLLMVGCNNTNEEVKNEPVSSGNAEVTVVEAPVESGELTEDMAYEGIKKYCNETYGYTEASSSMYIEIGDGTDDEYQMRFRSYTGAYVYFYIDKSTGVARMVETVPDLNVEEEAGTINVYDYLNK
ncbi:MAG: hypothetical protein IKR04_04035 [Clostridia bacterium]|nr:hypothetical protein [Clostridia bacterium]